MREMFVVCICSDYKIQIVPEMLMLEGTPGLVSGGTSHLYITSISKLYALLCTHELLEKMKDVLYTKCTVLRTKDCD